MGGIIRNVTKNLFAAFRFNTFLVLGGAVSIAGLGSCPALSLLGPPATRLAGLVTLMFQVLLYRAFRREGGSSPAYALLLPAATVCLAYAMLRSVAVTLYRGAVVWRGTAYPLKELRANAGPMV